MSLLLPGTNYVLEGIPHRIADNEVIVGSPIRWDDKKQTFFTTLKSLLRALHETCTQHQIPYWLSCGTLLGQVKYQGFVPNDTDADVGIPQQYLSRLQQLLAERGLRVVPFRYGLKLCASNSWSYPFVDLMAVAVIPPSLLPADYDRSEPVYAFSYPLDRRGRPTFELRWFFNKKYIPESWLFPLASSQFEGMTMSVPLKSKEICERFYGTRCLTTTTTKRCRKHSISGVTAYWGHQLCQWIGWK